MKIETGASALITLAFLAGLTPGSQCSAQVLSDSLVAGAVWTFDPQQLRVQIRTAQ